MILARRTAANTDSNPLLEASCAGDPPFLHLPAVLHITRAVRTPFVAAVETLDTLVDQVRDREGRWFMLTIGIALYIPIRYDPRRRGGEGNLHNTKTRFRFPRPCVSARSGIWKIEPALGGTRPVI